MGDASALADDFILTHRSQELPVPSGRLDLPVVITQRRPKARTRGFIQAYAPLLEDAGIDQPAFLDFIDKLNKAVQPSPWLQAINLASLAAQNVPEPVILAVSMATKMAADAASEIDSRTKTNTFLDKTNEEYFKPRGLVALLMTWKPQDSSVVATVDFDLGTTITSPSPGSGGLFGKAQSHMKSSSAAASFEFPETAALVFPALDELASTTPESPGAQAKKQNIIKRSGSFLTDHLDRRAVAKWAGDHPGSKMANLAPKPEFRSRLYGERRPPYDGCEPLLLVGGVRKLLRKDVLCLMIVNRPSEVEMAASAAVFG
ncbi:putative fad binding domain protein [Diaporthe ampelina]|uniref:Putative fad binding domain protein n=1 Tax=Diaporthe ampelina TaxID=1214573 RepID=A0A0G2FM59_9PEZI|nr:putative fad binding domain protein [Diaporthe ampelina]